MLTAKPDLEPKLRAVAPAREAAVVAEAARVAALEAAREVALDREPISVFISRRLQRLYVRRGFQPVFDEEITIQDTDRSIGTHVFTAVHRVQDSFRWTVVSLNTRSHESRSEAKTALDRIVIPPAALERINEMVSVRSSLIISDEELSSETGNATDFVLVLSGEPQGSLKIRKRVL